MSAEIGVNVGAGKLGRAFPVDGPVGKVTDDALAVRGDRVRVGLPLGQAVIGARC